MNSTKQVCFPREISTPARVSRKDLDNLLAKVINLGYDVSYEYDNSRVPECRYRLTSMNESVLYSEMLSAKNLYLVLLTIYVTHK